jgi:beta-fructofuranosidase
MWHGRKPEPELVKGAICMGVRTDGYSSFLSLKTSGLTLPRLQLKGYFALESYPNDTAGFFTVYGKNHNNWVSACINKFGIAYLCVSENGKYHWIPSQVKLAKFKWIHVALSLKDSAVWVSMNGKRILSVKINAANFTGIDSVEIGKDGRKKRIAVFPINYINGIIDQPQLTVQPDQKFDVTEIKRINKLIPHLAIPESRFEGDFSRPRYHLLPAANWTNETHGLIYYNGLYHIFNQKNAGNLLLDQINWGHYTSKDLIHWVEHKPILTPEPGYDENGIWSGCVVLDGTGLPNVFYSSSGPVSYDVCRALPNDKTLLTWYKPSGNPVINSSPSQYSRKDFHDPYVWKDGKKWYMIVGFGLTDNNYECGAVLLYRSEDLKHWTYLHPLFSGNPSVDNSGVFWEMPVFYKLGDKYILLVNKVPHKGVPARALYWVGKFESEKFIPDNVQPKNLEVINRLLSPSVTRDASGNIVAIAIIPDETSPRATYNVGWTHLYSIPRVWTLKNGKICQQPYPGLKVLRGISSYIPHTKLSAGDTLLLSAGKQQVEINVDLVPDTTGEFGFLVGKNASGSEYSKIYYDFKRHQLIVDQTKSTIKKYIPLNIRTGDYSLEGHRKVNFHLFFDGSVIEGFINNEDAFTTRIFPASANSTQIELFSEGGSLKVLNGTSWNLKSSNNKTDF